MTLSLTVTINKTLKWPSLLPILMQESSGVIHPGDDSGAIGIYI